MHVPGVALRTVEGLLALYGAGVALWQITTCLKRFLAPPSTGLGVKLLLFVRDQEHMIEGFLRTVIGEVRVGCEEIVVLDTGSADDTPAIVERLARQLGGLRVLRSTTGLPSSLLPAGQMAVVVDLQGPVDVHPILNRLRRLLAERSGPPPRGLSSAPGA